METKFIFFLFSYDALKKTMDKGFPKRVDETFSGMTGKVTAGFVLRGKCKFIQSFKGFQRHLAWYRELTWVLCSTGYAYLYSGPNMFEFSMGSKKLYRVLKNDYFLRCTNH